MLPEVLGFTIGGSHLCGGGNYLGLEAEVVKEDNVFPMIPAGAAIKDMIIEKPKVKMEKPSGST